MHISACKCVNFANIHLYMYVCMYVCVYIYSYLYIHIHMSQILTKCIVISISHCKFKKRLHPSFKKNFHAPLQTIRFLSSAFKKSSPIQEELHPPLQTIRFLSSAFKKVLIPHSRRHCIPHCRFKKRLHPPFKKITSLFWKENEDFATDLAQTHVSLYVCAWLSII